MGHLLSPIQVPPPGEAVTVVWGGARVQAKRRLLAGQRQCKPQLCTEIRPDVTSSSGPLFLEVLFSFCWVFSMPLACIEVHTASVLPKSSSVCVIFGPAESSACHFNLAAPSTRCLPRPSLSLPHQPQPEHL